MPKYILIEMTNIQDEEKILKAARVKQHIIHKKSYIRLLADFLGAEILQNRRKWHGIYKGLKGGKNIKTSKNTQQGLHSDSRERL